MEDVSRLPSPVRFGTFEVDLQASELRKSGLRVRLQEQPFQVLRLLLEHPGEVVTREHFRKRIWVADTFVDFERGLNRGINKVREALDDDAENPIFIETIPRRGYRFLAAVESAGGPLAKSEHHDNPCTPLIGPKQRTVWLAGATILMALTAFAVVLFLRPWKEPVARIERPLMQFDLETGSEEFLQPAISHDGMRVAFVTESGISVRRLDRASISTLNHTDGASFPFFSPNGLWIGFFAHRKLQKISVEGGSPIALCDAPVPGGGSWSNEDEIVASLGHDGLSRIPASGGTPQRVGDVGPASTGDTFPLWPQVLPDGKGILFTAMNGSKEGALQIRKTDGRLKTIVERSTYGRYLDGGIIIFHRQGSLFAAPMDLSRLELSAPPVLLLANVSVFNLGRADFDVSGSGTLVYRGGTGGTRFNLSWLYNSGKTESALLEAKSYFTPRLSPDGGRVAFSIAEQNHQNLWVYDFRRTTLTRLTSGEEPDLLPTWTPDGDFVAFRSGNHLAWTRSDGSGKVDRMAGGTPNVGPWTFSADGKWLAFWPLQPNSDLWTVPVEQSPGSLNLGKPELLLQHPGSKGAPAISPDDRWMAYTSDETGRFEIYVMSFSPHAKARPGRWMVSNGGGICPRWSRDGGKLFYQDWERRIHVVPYSVREESFVPENARVWSEKRLGDTGIFPAFDVAPDGKRVLALLGTEDPKAQSLLRVMLHVDSDLQRRWHGR
jgi:eukaryotic-like serine/threonine-protein kinase